MNQEEKILLKGKFLKNCTEEEEYFFKQLEEWLKENSSKAEENKKKYLDNNEKLIQGDSAKESVQNIWNILKKIFAPLLGITFISTIFAQILEKLKEVDVVVYVIVTIILLIILVLSVIFIFYQKMKIQKTLKFRRYGETWIRHRVVVGKYKREILKYLCNLEEYEGQEASKQKKIFMTNILKINAENIQKFETNMQNITEVVE